MVTIDKSDMHIAIEQCCIHKGYKQLLQIGDYYPSQSKSFNFGNDYLYLFFEQHPLPRSLEEANLEINGAEQSYRTKYEAAFADQLWLIGRAYAASPERYSYFPKKANQKKLG